MDGSRFDALTRAAAAAPSRRALLGAALGGLAATLVGRGAEAAVLRGPGEICRKPGDCATGLCNPPDRTGRQYCGCTDPSQCPPPKDACHIATCTGTCGIAVNVGAACDDRNACTTGETCQVNGRCGGGTATVCTALDQCHTAGTCDPKSGICTNPNASDGITCETGNRCTADTCDGQGACVQGPDVVTPTCPAPTQCQVSVGCNPATGECDHVVNRNSGFSCGAGPSCVDGTQHAQDACDGSGACVPGADTGCGLFVCGTTSCRTTCGTDIDCVGAAHCDDGVCLGDRANGAVCDEASDCQSGFCNSVSAFCCSQNCAAGADCTGAGFTCGVPPCGTVGQACCAGEVCAGAAHCDGGNCVANLANGQPCDEPSDCQSGICNATSGICCGQSCGAGVACVGAGTTCDDPTCGGSGQACCAGNACDSGACSRNLRCEPCGDLNQICCFDSHNIPYCNGGLGCPDGACWPAECGGPNEACCDGTRCQNGLVCDTAQICRVPCGGNGQVCCAGGTCGSGLACDGQSCRACGALNQACCAGDVCAAGLECGASFSGNQTKCVANCGAAGETCCRAGGAAVCDAGLECNANAQCVANGCGSPGQICCYLRECDGAPCSINIMCEPCGNEVGQPCCFANVQYCNNGLFCPDRTCAA
jgi:hypothetical protein